MLTRIIRRLPAALITLLVLPVIAADYFKRDTGREYGIGLADKLVILIKMVRNNIRVISASNFISHLLMASRVFNVPRATPGVLVECGAYKGGSTTNLSLVAAAVGRRLHVFDSFAGLPAPDDRDTGHVVLAQREVRTYGAGDYTGTYDEVSGNVARYGVIDVCEFHQGYFEDTLPGFSEPVIFVYLDVDLVKSEETCLRFLWPLLVPGSYLFTDEAHHYEIAELFHDRVWWQNEIGDAPPGLVGAGNGIGLFLQPGGFGSGLGYTTKVDRAALPHLPG